jgi:hypothetical protein
MEETIIQSITDSFSNILDVVNWAYVAVTILLTWLVNELIKTITMPKWLKWFKNLNAWRALTIGSVFLIPLFAFFGRFQSREEYYGLFISLMLSMILYAIGIKSVLKWVKTLILKIK